MSEPILPFNGIRPTPTLDEVTIATAVQEASDSLLILELERRGYHITKD